MTLKYALVRVVSMPTGLLLEPVLRPVARILVGKTMHTADGLAREPVMDLHPPSLVSDCAWKDEDHTQYQQNPKHALRSPVAGVLSRAIIHLGWYVSAHLFASYLPLAVPGQRDDLELHQPEFGSAPVTRTRCGLLPHSFHLSPVPCPFPHGTGSVGPSAVCLYATCPGITPGGISPLVCTMVPRTSSLPFAGSSDSLATCMSCMYTSTRDVRQDTEPHDPRQNTEHDRHRYRRGHDVVDKCAHESSP